MVWGNLPAPASQSVRHDDLASDIGYLHEAFKVELEESVMQKLVNPQPECCFL